MKVADAVAFAHAHGVMHRDLKPENVMLGDYGEVLVMDWGLALVTPAFRQRRRSIYQADSMGGTPAYMAPEMAIGPGRADRHRPATSICWARCCSRSSPGLAARTAASTTEECVLAAARNEIQPTEDPGELIDIAYRAMATDPAGPLRQRAGVSGRDARVSTPHCESILLADPADEEFDQAAARPSDYQAFAQALFGFERRWRCGRETLGRARGNLEAKLATPSARRPRATSSWAFRCWTRQRRARGAAQRPGSGPRDASGRGKNGCRDSSGSPRRMVLIVFGVITVALVRGRGQEPGNSRQGPGHPDKHRGRDAEAKPPEVARAARRRAKGQSGCRRGKGRSRSSRPAPRSRKAKTAEEEEAQAEVARHRGRTRAKAEEEKASPQARRRIRGLRRPHRHGRGQDRRERLRHGRKPAGRLPARGDEKISATGNGAI